MKQPKSERERCLAPSFFAGWVVVFPRRVIEEYTDLECTDQVLPVVLDAVEKALGQDVDRALRLGVSVKICLLTRLGHKPVELDIIAFKKENDSLKLTCSVVHERQLFRV